jgi:monoamine oxidase
VSTRAEALVVGAGLSGLTAAYRLQRAGADVAVLEARDRVGGRAWRIPVGDAGFDAGCEALDREHTILLRLAHEVGVEVWEAPPWPSGRSEHLDAADTDLFDEFERAVEELAARVDPDHPGELEGAWELDTQSLAAWLEGRAASPRLFQAVEHSIAVASSTVPTSEMSLLAYAVKLAAGAAPTGLTLRFEGGPSALAAALVEHLDRRVRTSAPVVGVEDEGNEVAVRLEDGSVERAKRVVVAVPLTAQRSIRFEPPLPQHRLRALTEARYGEVVKQAALFDEPPILSVPDVSSAGHLYLSAHEPRLLIRFAGAGAAGREVSLERVAGAPPRGEAQVVWQREAWTQGSYLILGPGQLLSWGDRLGESHGRIHFAGAERSTLKSYMEGAARAGEDVATEVLAAR